MNETDTGIERETIPFSIPANILTPNTLEVKYTITGSTFKTQLPIFKGGTILLLVLLTKSMPFDDYIFRNRPP